MDGRGTYLRVGLLLVIAAVVALALVVFLTGRQFSHGKAYETYFRESVQGLDVGAEVKFRGVTLGRVTQIGLVSAEYGRDVSDAARSPIYQLVFVRFVIDTSKVGRVVDTPTLVQHGLRARLASQGLTGLSYLELDFVQPGRYPPIKVPWQPRDDYIPSMPSTLTQVQDAAQQLLQKINTIDINGLVNGLMGLVGDLRDELKTGDVHTTLAQATKTLQAIQDSVKQANLPALTAQLQDTAKTFSNVANGPHTADLMRAATSAVDRLSRAATALPPLIAALQQTVRRADSTSADVQQALLPALRDIQATISNLRDTTEMLRQAPGQVLFGGPPPRNQRGAR